MAAGFKGSIASRDLNTDGSDEISGVMESLESVSCSPGGSFTISVGSPISSGLSDGGHGRSPTKRITVPFQRPPWGAVACVGDRSMGSGIGSVSGCLDVDG